jgi:hypothetical protein
MKNFLKLARKYLLWVLFLFVANTALLVYTLHHEGAPHLWILPLGIFFFLSIPPGFLLRWEIRVWNNGVCRKHGIEWYRADTDSQGGRMYTAGKGKRKERIWLSWINETPIEPPVCYCGELIRDHHLFSSCTYAVEMERPPDV